MYTVRVYVSKTVLYYNELSASPTYRVCKIVVWKKNNESLVSNENHTFYT